MTMWGLVFSLFQDPLIRGGCGDGGKYEKKSLELLKLLLVRDVIRMIQSDEWKFFIFTAESSKSQQFAFMI